MDELKKENYLVQHWTVCYNFNYSLMLFNN